MNSRKYLGIPYADHGRTKAGLDCWGLVRLIYRDELGIELPSWSAEYDDSDNVSHSILGDNQLRQWTKVNKPDIYDVAILSICGNFHTGVCIGTKPLRMIHILKDQNVCIEKLNSPMWIKRLEGWYRYA